MKDFWGFPLPKLENEDCEPDKDDYPTMRTLQDWLLDSGCEATDGCWVEHDGHCEHGCPSWFLYLGVI